MKLSNFFAGIPTATPGELTSVLVQSANIRVERIVSLGHASPKGFWYDQVEHEFVLLLQGQARMRIQDERAEQSRESIIELISGDWLNIPAHQKHRVEWTTPDQPTIWLAVFYS